MASYRDPQLVPTIKDCLAMAEHPENLVFSIAWQHSREDKWDSLDEFKGDPRFKIIDIDYRKSRGVCWARNLLQQNYAGEEYTLQLDSHHRFTQDWDWKLLAMYDDLKRKGHEKPLLTGYPPSFNPVRDPQDRLNIPQKMNFDRFAAEGFIRFVPAAIHNYKELSGPLPARSYSAGFAFTTGAFVEEVPHDPNYYFHGEETSITVRAFTWDYDLFHPHRIITWHEYTRKGKPKQWDDDPNWVKKNRLSIIRNRKLFEMDGEIKDIDFGPYDFGNHRLLGDYERYAGISFKHRAVQQYTLDHLPPPNPPLYEREALLHLFKHDIELQRHYFTEHDYDFWAVIFENDDNQSLFRKDVIGQELTQMLQSDALTINIQREFYTSKKPTKWIVWPHSKSKGWLTRIEGSL